MQASFQHRCIPVKFAKFLKTKMSDGRKRIQRPFVSVKNEKLGITLEKNIFRYKEDKI